MHILQNAWQDTRTTDLYNKFHTLTLPNLYKFNILLFVRKFHKFCRHRDQLLNVFSSYFVQNSELHFYNTRIKDEPHFPSVGSNLCQPSIKYQDTHLWCFLPQELKTISTRLFKRKLKNYLQNVHHDLN